MCGRVVSADVLIPSAADHFAAANNNGSNWNLSCFKCTLRSAQSFFHPEFVGGHGGCH
jgi:hypothetical protein